MTSISFVATEEDLKRIDNAREYLKARADKLGIEFVITRTMAIRHLLRKGADHAIKEHMSRVREVKDGHI